MGHRLLRRATIIARPDRTNHRKARVAVALLRQFMNSWAWRTTRGRRRSFAPGPDRLTHNNTPRQPVTPSGFRHWRNGRPLNAGRLRRLTGTQYCFFGSCEMAAVPFDVELAERIRYCLDALDVREGAMSGGRSLMVSPGPNPTRRRLHRPRSSGTMECERFGLGRLDWTSTTEDPVGIEFWMPATSAITRSPPNRLGIR